MVKIYNTFEESLDTKLTESEIAYFLEGNVALDRQT